MTTTRAQRAFLSTTAMLVLAGSAPVAASTVPAAPEMRTDSPKVERIDRARELRAQAEALFSQPKQWRRTVRLLEQSAELRDAADPEAFTCLLFAGRMRAVNGDMARAQQVLERAAEGALARGAIVEAATAYLDAAHAAAGVGRVDQAQVLLTRAQLLTESPLLSAGQREALLTRVEA